MSARLRGLVHKSMMMEPYAIMFGELRYTVEPNSLALWATLLGEIVPVAILELGLTMQELVTITL